MNLILFPLILFAVAVVLSALFSGYEMGFVSSKPIRVQHIADQESSTRAVRLLKYIQNPDQMLTALLIGNNLMLVVCSLIISFEVTYLLPNRWAGAADNILSTLIVAPVMLLFAEIIPKSVFRMHPTRLSLVFLPFIEFFYILFAPIAFPISWVTRGLFRVFGGEHRHLSPLMASLEDVRILVDEGVDDGTIERDEQEMIHSVIDLQTTTAKEIMVPRIAIQALPETATRSELVQLFEESGRTRIPIYRDTIDTIIGVVNAYSILNDTEPAREDITRFVKEVVYVPDTINAGELFRTMKDSKQYLAIVTDEYGGTDGLITLEDILEEIFGEIQDEHDREESPIRKLGPNAYAVDARMPIEEVSDVLGMPIEDEDVETIGGWLTHIAGRIPAPGQIVEHGRFRMTVLDAKASHIIRIRLEVLPENTGADTARPD